MEDIHTIDLDPDLIISLFHDVNIRFTKNYEQIAFASVL